MRAAVDDLAVLVKKDLIGIQHRGQTVRYHQGGLVRKDRLHAALDLGFGLRVDRGRRFVHDDQFGVEGQRPREADQLFLALGNVLPALGQFAVQAEVLGLDEFVQLHDVDRFPHFFDGHGVVVNAHVFQNAAGKEENVLQDQPDLAAPGAEIEVGERHAVDQDASLLDGVKSAEQAHRGRFAAAGSPHQRDLFAFRHGEGNVFEDPFLLFVGEPDFLEADLVLEGRQPGPGEKFFLGLQFRQFQYAFERHEGALDLHHVFRNLHQRPDHAENVIHKNDQSADGDSPGDDGRRGEFDDEDQEKDLEDQHEDALGTVFDEGSARFQAIFVVRGSFQVAVDFFLLVEGLDDRHALYVISDLGRYQRVFFPDLPVKFGQVFYQVIVAHDGDGHAG